MVVRAYSPVLPSIELFGAYEGIAVATGVNQTVSLTFTPTSEGNLTIVPYDGDGNISQFQLEAASTPSSYIPTPEGATATRAADVLTIPAANLPWPEPVYVTNTELFSSPTLEGSGTVTDVGSGAYDFNWSSGAIGSLVVANVLTAGNVYEVTFTISDHVSGSLAVSLQAFANGGSYNADGTYTTYVVATSGDDIRLDRSGTTGSFTVSNISVKEINPLSVSIQMQGRMTYADTDSLDAVLYLWRNTATDYLGAYLYTTGVETGEVNFFHVASGTTDSVRTKTDQYSPGINVPFNIASRHGSTFVNGAVDGVALTANTTPVALPDLSATDLNLGYDFMGTIKTFRMWADDLGDTGIEEASS